MMGLLKLMIKKLRELKTYKFLSGTGTGTGLKILILRGDFQGFQSPTKTKCI